jgi:hypothetical protein
MNKGIPGSIEPGMILFVLKSFVSFVCSESLQGKVVLRVFAEIRCFGFGRNTFGRFVREFAAFSVCTDYTALGAKDGVLI